MQKQKNKWTRPKLNRLDNDVRGGTKGSNALR